MGHIIYVLHVGPMKYLKCLIFKITLDAWVCGSATCVQW